MAYLLENCNIISGGKTNKNASIFIDGDIIKSISQQAKSNKNIESIDLEGLNVAPGMLDIQVNGGGGFYFTDDISEASLRMIYNAHLQYGITRMVITLISTSLENIYKAIDVVRDFQKKEPYGIIGLHLEGPFLSPEKRGAHDIDYLRKPVDNELNEILKYGRDVVKVMTISPELFKPETIKAIADKGIKVLAGHSKADYTTAQTAFASGVSGVTHLYNALEPLKSRDPGVIGALFDNDNACANIIVDGLHCDYAMVRIAEKILKNRLFFISDSTLCACTGITKFKVGNQIIYNQNGRCINEDGSLAGASINLWDAVRNAYQKVGFSLTKSIDMASLYPAVFMGVDNQSGTISEGKLADLIVFDNNLNIKMIFKNGKKIK